MFGFSLSRRTHTEPRWTPKATQQTLTDRPDMATRPGETLSGLWLRFGLFAIVVAVDGGSLMRALQTIAADTALSETQVGTVFAFFTSMPELVTPVAAVCQGALTLAVGNILGINLLRGSKFFIRSAYHSPSCPRVHCAGTISGSDAASWVVLTAARSPAHHPSANKIIATDRPSTAPWPKCCRVLRSPRSSGSSRSLPREAYVNTLGADHGVSGS